MSDDDQFWQSPRPWDDDPSTSGGPRHARSRSTRRRRDGTVVPHHHYGWWLVAVVVAGLGSYLGVIHSSTSSAPTATRTAIVNAPLSAQAPLSSTVPDATAPDASGGSTTPAAKVGELAPNGTFTTLSGTTSTIASLHGKALMVWFVADGCASCSVSIPAVAQHLSQLASDGVQIVTLGLSNSFSAGSRGMSELASFGHLAAHMAIPRPGWTWGMASTALAQAYDPTGTPDVYALVGPGGHIRYMNSVPVSTMAQLLAVAKHLDQATRSSTTTKATDATTQSVVVAPCC